MMALSLSGCYRDAIVSGAVPQDQPAVDKWRSHFLWGLVRGVDDFDERSVCPSGIARIEMRQNGWQGLVNVLTLGIYTPFKLKIFCAVTGEAHSLSIDMDAERLSSLKQQYPNLEYEIKKQERLDYLVKNAAASPAM